MVKLSKKQKLKNSYFDNFDTKFSENRKIYGKGRDYQRKINLQEQINLDKEHNLQEDVKALKKRKEVRRLEKDKKLLEKLEKKDKRESSLKYKAFNKAKIGLGASHKSLRLAKKKVSNFEKEQTKNVKTSIRGFGDLMDF